MGPFVNDHLRIIRSWPGEGTGDMVYEAVNGSIWRTCHHYGASGTTPPLTGRICDGFIYVGETWTT